MLLSKDVRSTAENKRGLKILKLILIAKMLLNDSINDEKIPHCRQKMVGVISATEVRWLSPTRHQLELHSLHFNRGAISMHQILIDLLSSYSRCADPPPPLSLTLSTAFRSTCGPTLFHLRPSEVKSYVCRRANANTQPRPALTARAGLVPGFSRSPVDLVLSDSIAANLPHQCSAKAVSSWGRCIHT